LKIFQRISNHFSTAIWQIISWILWRVQAGNAHGLHSPFVFAFYNAVLSAKAGTRQTLLPRTLTFLGVAPALLVRPYIFLLIEVSQSPDLAHLELLLADNSCEVMLGIRTTASRFALFTFYSQSALFSLTIDSGHTGFLFRRTGVVKQHFLLRAS